MHANFSLRLSDVLTCPCCHGTSVHRSADLAPEYHNICGTCNGTGAIRTSGIILDARVHNLYPQEVCILSSRPEPLDPYDCLSIYAYPRAKTLCDQCFEPIHAGACDIDDILTILNTL